MIASLLILCNVILINPQNGVLGNKISSSISRSTSLADSIKRISPPHKNFYTKYLDANGIPVWSADVVDDKALYLAADKINRMLFHMSKARVNLITNGAEFHIIGKDQQTSDLPEFANERGIQYLDNGVLTDIDKRTRGKGGLYASCGEENLLNLPNDRYGGGYDICIHEFAHTIMAFGLDERLRSLIDSNYQNAVSKGLWKGAYAGSNPFEYWAELSSWYFGARGDFLPGTKSPQQGPAALRAYDYNGYSLVASIYSGILEPEVLYRKPVGVISGGEKSGISGEKAVLTLINNRSEKLMLYWIDFEGGQHLYGSLDPGSTTLQPTSISHVWMIGNNSGELIRVKIDRPKFEVEINPVKRIVE